MTRSGVAAATLSALLALAFAAQPGSQSTNITGEIQVLAIDYRVRWPQGAEYLRHPLWAWCLHLPTSGMLPLHVLAAGCGVPAAACWLQRFVPVRGACCCPVEAL